MGFLIRSGRPWQAKNLALTAPMRNLAVILNAFVRDGQPWCAPRSA